MAVAEVHPNIADLEAFILGTLDDASLAGVEAHLADCPTCQERAAGASGDNLVELLRRVHAQAAHRNDTVAEVAAQAHTPAPVPTHTVTVTLPPAAPTDSEGAEVVNVIPPELAGHDRYRVLRLLGAGGMGAVYEAEHRVMRRAVALKVINRAYTTSPAAVERFRREVRAAARLSHPNIVTTYDAEDAGNGLFLVMEYAEGVSLARMVKERGPLPAAEACACVRQAALGLQHAHERGMVHRDVKPDNLIRCTDGSVKVLDFGLAALTAERGSGLTDTNVIMGTPDYMAPEQAEDARKADIRADVYSLGCTLYFLLTGHLPYPADTSLLKILAHREKPLPPLRQARPDAPPELAGIVARMLAKKPEDRYQTPGDVAVALEPFTRLSQEVKRPSRWFQVAAAAALLFMALAAGIVVHHIQTDAGELVITTEGDDVEVFVKQGGKLVRVIDTKTNKSLTLRSGVYELELKDGGEGLKLNINNATLTRGKTVLATIERRVKQAGPVTQPIASEIRVLQRLPIPEDRLVWQTAVAPDGKLFAAGLDGINKVVVWDGQTGKEAYRLDGWLPAFTPDGQTIATVANNVLHVHDAATGERLRSIRTPSVFHSLVPMSDSRYALAHTADMKLHLCDLTAGKVLRSWRIDDLCTAWTSDGHALLVKPAGESAHVVWDVRNNKPLDGYARLAKYNRVYSFLPGDKQAVAGEGGHDYLVDVADGNRICELHDLPGPAVAGSRSPVYRGLHLTGYSDGKIRLFNYLSGQELGSLLLPEKEAPLRDFTIWLSADARHACVATNRSVYLLRLPDPPAAKDRP
jgi:tRNA A-37 threonylcarbamoyl transferase component Bud32